MLLLDLVDTSTIRAAIGVSEDMDELSDEFFTDYDLESMLSLELSSWIPSSTSLTTIIDNGDGAEQDTEEWKTYACVKTAAKYYCAWVVLQSRDISLFQRVEDGNNKLLRPTVKTDELLQKMLGLYNKYKDMALELISPSNAADTVWYVGSSSPTYDPVTNT
jgi:hypothetical protein